MLDQLGAESGSIQFTVGDHIFGRTLGGSKRFHCAMDEVDPLTKPINYTRQIQQWVYIGEEEMLSDEFFDPDTLDPGPFP